MIAQNERLPQPASWQTELGHAVSTLAELLRLLGLSPEQVALSTSAIERFPLRVPKGFVSRMRTGDPKDPLLRQVLPIMDEEMKVPGYTEDPVGDGDAEQVPGVLHKYQGRVLLLTTGACGMHCRYCFRRHFPYAASNPAVERWRSALEYIQRDTSIQEVILSGGDPLSLTDDRLRDLVQRLALIGHVKRLRIHTRMPVIVPSRITDELLSWLCGTSLTPVIVVHANHANEIDPSVRSGLRRLFEEGVTVLNQSVLLKGVNDNHRALIDLSEALFEAGVLPYYLHLLDRVAGAAHFEVSETVAIHLLDAMRRELPGYLVPRLVRERPGSLYKEGIPFTSLTHVAVQIEPPWDSRD
jgi:EF-P beta-lysylation protein EpmB